MQTYTFCLPISFKKGNTHKEEGGGMIKRNENCSMNMPLSVILIPSHGLPLLCDGVRFFNSKPLIAKCLIPLEKEIFNLLFSKPQYIKKEKERKKQ